MAEETGLKQARSAQSTKRVRLKKRPPVSMDVVDKPISTTQQFGYKPKAKFSEGHVRWTGYLTNTNNSRLRTLLAEHRIPSMTRFVNEAVEHHLQKKFGLQPDENN